MSNTYEKEVVIPSRGLLYEDIPGEFTIRNITTKEEKLIYSNDNEDFMYDLVEACTIEPEEVDLDQMVVADVHFLLVQLRMHTYGTEYNIEHSCNYCDYPNKWQVDFRDFDIYELEDDFVEPVEFTLPISEDEIGIKLLRGKDIKAIDKETERKIRKQMTVKGDPTMEIRMKKYIHSINGEEVSDPEAELYINKGLHGKDSAYFWSKINGIELGYDTTIRRKCINHRCKKMNEFAMPLTPEFFRPSFD